MTKILHDAAVTFMRYCFRKRTPNHNDSSGCTPDARECGQENQACWGERRYKSRPCSFTLPPHKVWSECLPRYEDGESDTRGYSTRRQPVEDENEPERAEEDHGALGNARAYSQGAGRVLRGRPAGSNPFASASWRGSCPPMPGPTPEAGSPAGGPTDGALGRLRRGRALAKRTRARPNVSRLCGI